MPGWKEMSPNGKKEASEEEENRDGKGGQRISVLKRSGGNAARNGSRSPRREVGSSSSAQPAA